MKFTCEKNALVSAISVASRTVAQKSTIPALEGIYIRAGVKLTLSGYNLETGITISVDADIQETGACIMPSRLFFDIIRKLPDDTVSISVDENFKVSIRGGISSFSITAMSSEDYPELPEVDSEKGIDLPQSELKAMIGGTSFAVSENQARPIHTGCLFEIEGSRLNVVAVDGYRLSVRRETVEGVPGDMKFVVPGASLREIERILGDDDDIVEIFPDSKNILFRIGGTTLITRLIDGEFLNYRAAIPKEFEHEVSADRQELIQCIERVSLIVSEKLKNPIRFHFDGSYVQMSCVTAIGKSYDECPFDGSIENLEIGFNNRYILEALRGAGDEQVKLQLKGALNPMIISPMEGDKYTYLVLPVRLKAND